MRRSGRSTGRSSVRASRAGFRARSSARVSRDGSPRKRSSAPWESPSSSSQPRSSSRSPPADDPKSHSFGAKLAQSRALFASRIGSGWWDGVPRRKAAKCRTSPLRTIRPMATTEDRESLNATRAWREELYDAQPERRGELLSTMSGLEVDPLYTPDNVQIDHDRDLGYPGVYPYTRGVYPSMYRGKLWTMRQFAGFGTAEETNERFRYPLDRLRHADADGLRLGPRALARRGRPRGRGDRLAGRHGDLVRWHPARRGL